ncbi:hypothetical protein DEO72_LG1g2340 [Vigna unguiculata]|uniref:Uncharacterized protein n=1 Tax=Vigna unguiculata TaxID=3917 RepID=A0A4D6KY16_VIGUN|nr:hypothetical protein DEO72_LG1g2340 [Vigna unguiculata]
MGFVNKLCTCGKEFGLAMKCEKNIPCCAARIGVLKMSPRKNWTTRKAHVGRCCTHERKKFGISCWLDANFGWAWSARRAWADVKSLIHQELDLDVWRNKRRRCTGACSNVANWFVGDAAAGPKEHSHPKHIIDTETCHSDFGIATPTELSVAPHPQLLPLD